MDRPEYQGIVIQEYLPTQDSQERLDHYQELGLLPHYSRFEKEYTGALSYHYKWTCILLTGAQEIPEGVVGQVLNGREDLDKWFTDNTDWFQAS